MLRYFKGKVWYADPPDCVHLHECPSGKESRRSIAILWFLQEFFIYSFYFARYVCNFDFIDKSIVLIGALTTINLYSHAQQIDP